MARAVYEIEKEIFGLERDDQERLLRVLPTELDGPPDSNFVQAWLEEAQRRSRELDTGAVEAIPADEVFAKARDQLSDAGESRISPCRGRLTPSRGDVLRRACAWSWGATRNHSTKASGLDSWQAL